MPKEGPVAPAFLPLHRPLHEILHRPSLDERLPNLLQPATVDPELMEPAKLTEARIDARSLLHEHARHSSGTSGRCWNVRRVCLRRTSFSTTTCAPRSPCCCGDKHHVLDRRAQAPPSEISRKERDFLLLNIFVLLRHGYGPGGVLAEALYAIGERSAEVLFARTVLRFLKQDWSSVLICLDELDRADPVERFGSYKLTERQRMRRYLKARSLYELKAKAGARDAVETYLRHGASGQEIAE